MKILLALGSDPHASLIAQALRMCSWAVVPDPTGEDAEHYVADGGIDAVLFDGGVRDLPPLIERLRRAAPDLAILVLAAAPTVAQIAKLFDAGADDVLRRPLGADEVSLRACALARRRHGHRTRTITFGNLAVVPGSHAEVDGLRVPLTLSQFQILEFLALRAGRVGTREALLGALYGGRDEPNVKIIDVYMTKLRGMLAACGVPAGLIGTVWGRGYIMPAPFAAGTPMPAHAADILQRLPLGHSPRRYTAAALAAGAGRAA